MSDPTAQEPTMEEILASIRRIISEDDAPAAAPAAAAPAPAAPAPVPAPEPAPVAHVEPEPEEDEEEDVLELTQPAPVSPPRETHGDLDVFEKPKAVEPKPEPVVEMAPVKIAEPKPEPTYAPLAAEPEPEAAGLTSGHTASAAASHFGALAQSISMPAHGRTLEDVVGELLRPLLKDWLDQHLPAMVEQAVRDEVERISRRRVY